MPPKYLPTGIFSIQNTPEELLTAGYGTDVIDDYDPAFGELLTKQMYTATPYVGRPFQNVSTLSPSRLGFYEQNPSFGGISGYRDTGGIMDIIDSIPINKGPVGTFTDDAGLEEEDYEVFPEVEKNKKGLAGLFQKIIGFAVPGLNLVRGGLEGIRNFNDRIRNTDFGRSRTLAEYFQRRRDRNAREEAAARRAAKQKEIARQTALQAMRSNDAYGGGGGGGGFSGGFADNSNASAPGGSDEMGSF